MMWQSLLNLLLLLVLFGGVQTTTAPFTVTAPSLPSTTPVAASDLPLSAALTFAPADASHIEFTDWALIKRYEGAEALTGLSPEWGLSYSPTPVHIWRKPTWLFAASWLMRG